jgi:hypothetical protein
MTDADHLRSEARLCLDIAQQLSDHAAARQLRCEAAELFARAAESDASEDPGRENPGHTSG